MEIARFNAELMNKHEAEEIIVLCPECHRMIASKYKKYSFLSSEVKVSFISPVTGERKDAGKFLTGNLNGEVFPNGQTQFFVTPGHWEDALLLLEGVSP